MFNIDKCAYINKLSNTHPLEKLIFATTAIIICLSAKSLITPVLIFLIMTTILVFKAEIPFKLYAKLLILPFSFLSIGIISILVNIAPDPATTILQYKIANLSFGITENSIDTAIKLFFRAMGALSCMYFLTLTTPIVDLTNILKKLKIPDIFIELINLIYRLIFILIRVAGRIHTSQTSRLGYTSIKNHFRSLSQLVSSLFIISYKKACDLFIALDARGYSGSLNVLEKKYKFSYKNICFILVISIIIIYLELYCSNHI